MPHRRIARKRRVLKRHAKQRRRVKKLREEQLIRDFHAGIFPTERIVSQDENGRPVEDGELGFYSEAKLAVHRERVNPASLRQSRLWPRSLQPPPKVDYYTAFLLLRATIAALVAPFGLTVKENPLGPWCLYVGEVPDTTECRFHGSHFGSL